MESAGGVQTHCWAVRPLLPSVAPLMAIPVLYISPLLFLKKSCLLVSTLERGAPEHGRTLVEGILLRWCLT